MTEGDNFPKSIRLQRKAWEARDPEIKSKESKFYLIWFPEEVKYSIVEGKNIMQENPKFKDKVNVRDSSGTFEGIVYSSGSKDFCQDKQCQIENVCQTLEQNDYDHEEDEVTIRHSSTGGQVKRKASEKASRNNCKKPMTRKESESDCDDQDIEEVQSTHSGKKSSEELDLLKEKEKVNKLLLKRKEDVNKSTESRVEIERTVKRERTDELTFGLFKRLDRVISVLEKIANKSDTCTCVENAMDNSGPSTSFSSPQLNRQSSTVKRETIASPQASASPKASAFDDYENDPEFIVAGVNLLNDVAVKSKKPTLYATALMTYLFTDEEMREGSVEPREGGKKKALDQNKINLIKKCIRIKFGEKSMEKNWGEIRGSMNQKCLDKLKLFRKSL